MIPTDGEKLEDILLAALVNCEQFDKARFSRWLDAQPKATQLLARQRPPDRVYRVITDDERSSRGQHAPLILGIILGYRKPATGDPALAAVHVLGVKRGNGSTEAPLLVPADGLLDVTEDAKAGRIRFDDPAAPDAGRLVRS